MFGYFKYKINYGVVNYILDNQNTKKAFSRKVKCLNRVGNRIASTARVMGPLYSHCKLIVGEETFIGTNFHCEGNGTISIGNNCDIAPQVTILTGTHEIGNTQRRAGKGKTKGVCIGNGVWIGACSIILPGIKVGDGCIIGAGAVVTKDIPDNHIALGVPAIISPIEE